MTDRIARYPRQRLPAAACSAFLGARLANPPRRSGRRHTLPSLQTLDPRRTPELVELLSLWVAGHVPADSFCLLADAPPFGLSRGFGRYFPQQRGEADVACPRVRFEFFASLVVQADGNRRGHERDPGGYVLVLLRCNYG